MKKLSYFLIVILAFSSCDIVQNVDTEEEQPIILKSALQQKVSQDNEFSFDLLRNTMAISEDTNVVISPLSVSIALGMAWNGAANDTKTQLETALKMGNMSTDEINEYYQIIQSSLPKVDPKTNLGIANSLWYKTGFGIKQSFLDINSNNFGAYVKELEFDKSWAIDTINQWCSKKTKGLIPTILTEIPEAARLYLINAVYFKGIWVKLFNKDNTFESRFYDESGISTKVNMMNMTDTFPYWEDNQAQYVELPYGNGSFAMTIILPGSNSNINSVLSALNSTSWDSTLNSMTTQEVSILLPRFKTECKFSLVKPLRQMGMIDAFTDYADFSGISDERLLISEILHKTYIAVDEEGTEAAAVTSIGFETTSMPEYPVINVNHPFIFVIHERNSGVILFAGKMGKVSQY